MSNIDDLLKQLQSEPAVKQEDFVAIKAKKPFPWSTILLVVVIGVMGYFLWSNKSPVDPIDPIDPTVSIVQVVEDMENQYSLYKSQSYDKLAQLVSEGKINNRQELLVNAQAILDKAKKATLGKLDELDNQKIPEGDFSENRTELVQYLKDKAQGFKKASE